MSLCLPEEMGGPPKPKKKVDPGMYPLFLLLYHVFHQKLRYDGAPRLLEAVFLNETLGRAHLSCAALLARLAIVSHIHRL